MSSNQKHRQKGISPNTPESEELGVVSDHSVGSEVEKLHDFATRMRNAKSAPLQDAVRYLTRLVRRERLTYDQLRYLFKSVRNRCELEAPGRPSKLIELPTRDELKRFYAVITNPVHRLLFEFLHGTGLRVSELCSLEVRRIDFENNTIFISQGKGRKDRVVLAGSVLLEKVHLYLEGRKNRYLFESARKTRFSPRRLQQLCRHYKNLAQIERPLTVHTWRHLFITRLAEAGVSRERRAVLAGHADERVQQVYTHLSAGGLKNEVLTILDEIHRSQR